MWKRRFLHVKKKQAAYPLGMLQRKNESQILKGSKNLQERTNTSLSMTTNLLGLLQGTLETSKNVQDDVQTY